MVGPMTRQRIDSIAILTVLTGALWVEPLVNWIMG